MHAQYPTTRSNGFFTYRKPRLPDESARMRKLLPQEYARFGWYFPIQQHDQGFAEWMRLRRLGRRERIRPE